VFGVNTVRETFKSCETESHVGPKQLKVLSNCLQKYRETAKITKRETAYTTDIEKKIIRREVHEIKRK
jgi:hypothetical protein